MNSKNPYKTIHLVHWMVTLVLLVLAMLVFAYINSGNEGFNKNLMDSLSKIVPMSIVIGISASFYLGKKLIVKARKKKSLGAKIRAYQELDLVKMACLEIPGIVACVAAFLTGEIQFLFISFAVIIVMIIALPKKKKMILELDLNPSEIKEFNRIVEE